MQSPRVPLVYLKNVFVLTHCDEVFFIKITDQQSAKYHGFYLTDNDNCLWSLTFPHVQKILPPLLENFIW